ncbi:MAG TPA: TRAP transporter large permease subunit [Candidatus Paceibacterota bacterium]|nr:TRAP transporter large permease subunit [Verrucomicrobiota bacterium]HRY46556.1 TRAP transporter large permease subunit [Candidatus Paceibacterota bacterium]HSA02745.1 TRAP transporter large permease subunit [Candidatus Paceibacterota bacterium]
MSESTGAPVPATASGRCVWLRSLVWTENLVVVLPLAAMVLLPLAEVLLRKFTKISISGVVSFVQHFTLVVSVLGGAIAARDNRLLAMSPLPTYLRGGWKTIAAVLSHGLAAAVSAFLCGASWIFVASQKQDPRILAFGIPFWWFQFLMVIGFGAISLRLIWHASERWKWRLATAILALVLTALPLLPSLIKSAPMIVSHLFWPGMILLVVALILGAPIFSGLAGIAMLLYSKDGLPISLMPLEHYTLSTEPILPSLPLFTLAGYFLAEGRASQRLVRVFQALFGHLRGGPAILTALICALFTSFTGGSGVTILALGGLLLPVLVAARYSERQALGLFTSSGSLGLLFPPSLPLILYAIFAQTSIQSLELPADKTVGDVSINQMFVAGLVPGFLLVALTAWWGIRTGSREAARAGHFDRQESLRALWAAKWELALPAVILVPLLGGWATPVESAAVAALYTFVVQTFVHRDLRLKKDIVRVMTECGLLIGGVLLILGVAKGLTKYLVFADVPTLGMEWVQTMVHSPLLFLLLLNGFLLIVGCLMDVFSALVVVVPLIVPMAVAFNIDPVHLGIIFLANLELGYLTPPVGMNLFLASYRFNKPMTEITRAVLPLLFIRMGGVLLITYLPIITLALPRWLGVR